MHVFILILSLAGAPERIVAICTTYQECSDAGAVAQKMYVDQFHKSASDVSYRIMPATITADRAL